MSCAEAVQHLFINAKAALSNLEHAIAELQRQERQILQEKEELQQERINIEHARQQVETDRDCLEAEKATMMNNGVGPNNLVGLNFRGEKTVVIKRSVLCQIEGSMLAAMFSGRYENNLDRDIDGNVYIGYPPSVMIPLLDRLTALKDVPADAQAPTMNIPKSHQDMWDGAVKFFGLDSLFYQPPVAKNFSGVQQNLKMSDLPGWRVALCKPANLITTVDDFNLPGFAQDSHVLIGAKKPGKDELLVAAIGRRDIITTRGWGHHYNSVYWGFNDKVFHFSARPVAHCDASYALPSSIESNTCAKCWWSTTETSVNGTHFEKVIMVPA